MRKGELGEMMRAGVREEGNIWRENDNVGEEEETDMKKQRE